MAITEYIPRAVPNQAGPDVRAFLDDQLRRLAVMVNGAPMREEAETIDGDWTIAGDWEFTGDLVIPEAAVTDHESALAIAESQITDGSILARVAANESISGTWTFSNTITIAETGITTRLGSGNAGLEQAVASGNALFDINPTPSDGTSNAIMRFHRNVNTTGACNINFLIGKASTSAHIVLEYDPNGTGRNGIRIVQSGSLWIQEKASAQPDIAGHGQLWIKNTTPCELWFTDDVGTDTKIV